MFWGHKNRFVLGETRPKSWSCNFWNRPDNQCTAPFWIICEFRKKTWKRFQEPICHLRHCCQNCRLDPRKLTSLTVDFWRISLSFHWHINVVCFGDEKVNNSHTARYFKGKFSRKWREKWISDHLHGVEGRCHVTSLSWRKFTLENVLLNGQISIFLRDFTFFQAGPSISGFACCIVGAGNFFSFFWLNKTCFVPLCTVGQVQEFEGEKFTKTCVFTNILPNVLFAKFLWRFDEICIFENSAKLVKARKHSIFSKTVKLGVKTFHCSLQRSFSYSKMRKINRVMSKSGLVAARQK